MGMQLPAPEKPSVPLLYCSRRCHRFYRDRIPQVVKSLLHAAHYSVLVPLLVVPGAEVDTLFTRLPRRVEDPRELMCGGDDGLRGAETGSDAPVEPSEGGIAVRE
jgi:hypothetical protein